MNLFRSTQRLHNSFQFAHISSRNHAHLCAGLHAGLDSIKVALEYASLMERVDYPIEIVYPADWEGIKPNAFYSYEDWRQQFLFPVLSEFIEFADQLLPNLSKDFEK